MPVAQGRFNELHCTSGSDHDRRMTASCLLVKTPNDGLTACLLLALPQGAVNACNRIDLLQGTSTVALAQNI